MDVKQTISNIVTKGEEAVGLKPSASVEQPEVTQKDRSAFNCIPCHGEGLKDGTSQTELCPNCGGSGKV